MLRSCWSTRRRPPADCLPDDLAGKAARRARAGWRLYQVRRPRNDIDKQGMTIESDGRIAAPRLADRHLGWRNRGHAIARTLASRTQAETDHSARLRVNPDLTLPNYPGHLRDWRSGVAYRSAWQAAAGRGPGGHPTRGLCRAAIARKAQGKSPLPPFRYFDKGQLAVIGRAAAVADIFGLRLSGLVGLDHLGVRPPDVHRSVPKPDSGVRPMGIRGNHVQPRHRLITGRAATDFDFNREMAEEKRAIRV